MEKSAIEIELTVLGLRPDESRVYLFLINNGALTAQFVARRLAITRTLMYKILEDLITKQLIEKDVTLKINRFKALHPYALRNLALEQRRLADMLTDRVEAVINPLVSEYNLQKNKPGVHFMEGIPGLRTALEDTLTAKEPIRMFVDTTTLEQEVLDIDAEFAKKRLKKGLIKYILTPDSPESRSYKQDSTNELTVIHLVSREIGRAHV